VTLEASNMAPEQLKAVRNELFFLSKTLTVAENKLIDSLAGLSMLPPCRLIDAYRSACQAASRSIDGAVVEFGVYRGGALAAMAAGAVINKGFQGLILGFDTFEGHTTAPHPREVDLHGNFQKPIFDQKHLQGEQWAACDLGSVLKNYNHISQELDVVLPPPKLVKGDACETSKQLPSLCPNGISILRLDMDWYEPTNAALVSASPLLSKNALLIFDDYGHHSGVKEAVDLFLARLDKPFDKTMTDYSCLRVVLLA
jgi:O-methyltransferase